jgi:prepilin peptidase CpaA
MLFGFQGLWTALLGVLLTTSIPLLLWCSSNGRAIGGGDVKLLLGLGGLLGPTLGLESQWFSYLALLLFAFGKLSYQGKLLQTLRSALALAIGPILRRGARPEASAEMLTELRMGPAIFAGTLIANFASFGWLTP